MAISADSLKLSQSDRIPEPTSNTIIQRLIDEGSVYVPQAFTVPQFATLSALFHRLMRETEESPSRLAVDLDQTLINRSSTSLPLGLDELDALSRTRAGYAFADLTPEIQDAVLDLIGTGDLTTTKIDLALWIEDLRSGATLSASLAGC